MKRTRDGSRADRSRTKPDVTQWNVKFNQTGLAKNGFVIDSMAYTPVKLESKLSDHSFKKVIIDVNNEWKYAELKSLVEGLPQVDFWVYTDGLHLLDRSNLELFFEEESKKQFSLFPFYKLSPKENVLLISKSAATTPSLSDLEGSRFVEKLEKFLGEKTPKITLAELGNKHAIYHQTLEQFGVIELVETDSEKLKDWLSKGKFATTHVPDDVVQIGSKKFGVRSERTLSTNSGSVPDHLLRLHQYNKILDSIGAEYFTADSYVEGPLIDMAEYGHVVSPISSMIVLETVKDYDRFDIDESKTGLKNATTQSSGAVPEPHEWILIILALSIGIFQWIKSRGGLA